MPWVYLDDHIDEHDKTIAAGDAAFGLFVRLLAFCRRKQNGGRIPKALDRLSGQRAKVERLIQVGYLDDHGDHLQVHDYDVIYFKEDEERRRRSEKAKRAADARWNARSNAQASAGALPEECSNDATHADAQAPDPTPHTPVDKSPSNNLSVAANGGGGAKRSPTTLEVLERMADEELRAAQQQGGVRSPKAWRRAKLTELDGRYGARADELVEADPALTPSRLRGVLTNAAVANGYFSQREAG